jgi:hypothetical protein
MWCVFVPVMITVARGLTPPPPPPTLRGPNAPFAENVAADLSTQPASDQFASFHLSSLCFSFVLFFSVFFFFFCFSISRQALLFHHAVLTCLCCCHRYANQLDSQNQKEQTPLSILVDSRRRVKRRSCTCGQNKKAFTRRWFFLPSSVKYMDKPETTDAP